MSARSLTTAAVIAAGLVIGQASPAAAVTRNAQSSSTANGRVEAAVQIGSNLYIGGSFTAVDGASHIHLAALDATTGMLDPGFNVDVDVDGQVRSLAAAGTTLYVAGKFTTVGSATRKNVAAIDTTTGKVLPFKASPSSVVASVDVANGVVYIGGPFLKVSGTARPHLAALDAGTGAVVPGFNPQPSAGVKVVKVAGSSIYVGGDFTTIGGVARNFVARLGSTGTVQSWNATLVSGAQAVTDLSVGNDHVYLATAGGPNGGNSAYSINATSGATDWKVQGDGNVQAIEAVNGTVFVGGHFNYLRPCDPAGNCIPRKKAFAVEAATGNVLGWNPRFNTALGVWDLAAAGGNVYALGDFTTVNDISRPHIARFAL